LAFTKHATWRNKIGLHDEAQRFVEEPEKGRRRFIVLWIRLFWGRTGD
jgi:hypothetical protein